MKPDPTIDAIREVRHQISKSENHDAKKLVEHYRKLQERHLERHLERMFSRSVEASETAVKNAA